MIEINLLPPEHRPVERTPLPRFMTILVGVLDFGQVGDRATAVVTDAGRFDCDQVVLAAGVWTGVLAAKLGTALPIGPGKGYSVDYFPSPVPLTTTLTFEDAHVAYTPDAL